MTIIYSQEENEIIEQYAKQRNVSVDKIKDFLLGMTKSNFEQDIDDVCDYIQEEN